MRYKHRYRRVRYRACANIVYDIVLCGSLYRNLYRDRRRNINTNIVGYDIAWYIVCVGMIIECDIEYGIKAHLLRCRVLTSRYRRYISFVCIDIVGSFTMSMLMSTTISIPFSLFSICKICLLASKWFNCFAYVIPHLCTHSSNRYTQYKDTIQPDFIEIKSNQCAKQIQLLPPLPALRQCSWNHLNNHCRHWQSSLSSPSIELSSSRPVVLDSNKTRVVLLPAGNATLRR